MALERLGQRGTLPPFLADKSYVQKSILDLIYVKELQRLFVSGWYRQKN